MWSVTLSDEFQLQYINLTNNFLLTERPMFEKEFVSKTWNSNTILEWFPCAFEIKQLEKATQGNNCMYDLRNSILDSKVITNI